MILEGLIRMFASDIHCEINEAHPIVDNRLGEWIQSKCGVLKMLLSKWLNLTIRKVND